MQSAFQRFIPGTTYEFQIIGGPSWIDSDRYDIEAKADCSGGPISRDQYQFMVQSLIEDRFQLKAHLETRDVPLYELVVGKDGLKIKASPDQTPLSPPGPPPPPLCSPPPNTQPPPTGQRAVPFDPTKMRGIMSMQYAPGMATAKGNAVPITTLMTVLRLESGRPVIDKTNLKELFDFQLQFSPERMTTPYSPVAPLGPGGETTGPTAVPAIAADPVPTLLTAIQEQLGLRLESTKGPIEVLVIDSVQKPKEN